MYVRLVTTRGNIVNFDIVPFNKGYRRDVFDCGNDDLNDWLRTKAGQQERQHNTRTFLAIADGRIVGYYASTTYQLDVDEAAAALGSGSRRYPMPAILLARLAVDRANSGHNIGRRLVLHFLKEMARLSHSVGFEVVLVHAIDHDAASFYARCGFVPFADHQEKLFIATGDLRRTFGIE